MTRHCKPCLEDDDSKYLFGKENLVHRPNGLPTKSYYAVSCGVTL